MYNAVADRALHGSIPDPGGRWETTAAAYILYPLVQSTITTIHLLFPLCLHAAFYAARGRERLKISMSLSLSLVYNQQNLLFQAMGTSGLRLLDAETNSLMIITAVFPCF